MAWVGSVQPECTVPLSTRNFQNFKPEFLFDGKRPLSPGTLLAVLYFSFVPYFPACLDFPSPPLSAPGSPRMPLRATVCFSIEHARPRDDYEYPTTRRQRELQQNNRFNKQNNNFARASRFYFCISLPFLHDYDVKMPNLTFYG